MNAIQRFSRIVAVALLLVLSPAAFADTPADSEYLKTDAYGRSIMP